LTLRLAQPVPDLVARLALPYFCARKDNQPYPPNPIPSAGPYFVDPANKDGTQIVLRRNPWYHGPRRGGPDRVIVSRSADPISDLRAGAADWVPAWNLRSREELASAPVVRAYESNAPQQIVFNTRPGSPFANSRLRQAVALVVNRRELARGQRGSARATDLLTPSPLAVGRRGGYYKLRPDAAAINRARRLVENLGPIRVTVRQREPRIDQLIHDLAQIGISVALKTTAVCDPVSDLYVFPVEPLTPSFEGQLARYLEPGACTWPSDPPRDWAASLRRSFSKSGKSRLAYRKALEERIVTRDVPAVGLYVPMAQEAFSRRIGCFRPHPLYGVDVASLCLR
jgi:ABC-type transport system substrate-binding protein